MASAIPAIIAVAGTLLGSSLSYLYQRRSVEQAQAHAFGTLPRAERLTAYFGLASALMDWRRAQADQFNRQA
jgi:bacteriorhodopsin